MQILLVERLKIMDFERVHSIMIEVFENFVKEQKDSNYPIVMEITGQAPVVPQKILEHLKNRTEVGKQIEERWLYLVLNKIVKEKIS